MKQNRKKTYAGEQERFSQWGVAITKGNNIMLLAPAEQERAVEELSWILSSYVRSEILTIPVSEDTDAAERYLESRLELSSEPRLRELIGNELAHIRKKGKSNELKLCLLKQERVCKPSEREKHRSEHLMSSSVSYADGQAQSVWIFQDRKDRKKEMNAGGSVKRDI